MIASETVARRVDRRDPVAVRLPDALRELELFFLLTFTFSTRWWKVSSIASSTGSAPLTSAAPLAFETTVAQLEPAPIAVSKFDLTLYVEPSDDGLATRWEYNADIFDAARIERMARHFEQLLDSATAHPSQSLESLEFVTPLERAQLARWQSGPTYRLGWETLVSAFEQQVERTPLAPALVGRSDSFDYATVNRHANQLAHHLRRPFLLLL